MSIFWGERIPVLFPCEVSVECLAQKLCLACTETPPNPSPAQPGAQALREQQQEGTASTSLRAGQESEEGTLAGEDEGEGDIEQELSQWEGEEVISYHELSNWEEYLEQELPQNI